MAERTAGHVGVSDVVSGSDAGDSDSEDRGAADQAPRHGSRGRQLRTAYFPYPVSSGELSVTSFALAHSGENR